jgi:hypothetical protein
MPPDSKNFDDEALGARLRAGAGPVPAAGSDLRARIAAVAETPQSRHPLRPAPRAAAALFAAAACVALFLATPHRSGTSGDVLTAEETFVWETLQSVDDDGAELLLWGSSDAVD